MLHLLIKDTDQQERGRPGLEIGLTAVHEVTRPVLSFGPCAQVPGICMKPNDKENGEMTSKYNTAPTTGSLSRYVAWQYEIQVIEFSLNYH